MKNVSHNTANLKASIKYHPIIEKASYISQCFNKFDVFLDKVYKFDVFFEIYYRVYNCIVLCSPY